MTLKYASLVNIAVPSPSSPESAPNFSPVSIVQGREKNCRITDIRNTKPPTGRPFKKKEENRLIFKIQQD